MPNVHDDDEETLDFADESDWLDDTDDDDYDPPAIYKAVIAAQGQNGRLLLTTRACTICGKPGQLADIDPDAFAAWIRGALIQNVMPDRSPVERELLQSGLHAECYAQLPGARVPS